jgi:hypothetical protein
MFQTWFSQSGMETFYVNIWLWAMLETLHCLEAHASPIFISSNQW